MSTEQHILKVNNSYESEPSSGSGSSLSEHNELATSFDEDNLNLGIVIKPPAYLTHAATVAENSPAPDSNLGGKPSSAEKSAGVTCQIRKLLFDVPLHSSQESQFEGFTTSPFGSMRQRMYNSGGKEQVKTEVVIHSTGKQKFPKFYDIIIEENSCNAMDVQLQPPTDSSNDGGGQGAGVATEDGVVELDSAELSFNGKIKSLTRPEREDEASVPAESAVDPGVDAVECNTSMNTSQRGESFILKKYSNEKSPDLFGDDDDEDEDEAAPAEEPTLEDVKEEEEAPEDTQNVTGETYRSDMGCPTETSFADGDELTMDSGCQNDTQRLYRENCYRDKELLRRMRECLAGVPPPPSLTIPQIDLFSAVLSRKDDILNFFSKDTEPETREGQTQPLKKSLFAPTHSLEEVKNMPWRDILTVRQHGLSFNLTRASESKEYLGLSVIERFIGAETSTSFKSSPTSAKKRSLRMKLLTQSPGNRLSHLAKRRAIFSSANLATTSLKTNNAMGPKIALDKKKPKNKRKATPKRMTPGSKKKARKTPSSSARKRLFRHDLIRPGPSRESSKRALFQSPAKQLAAPKPVVFKPEIANRVEKSKRALFSPESDAGSSQMGVPSSSALQSLLKRKRPADEEDKDMYMGSSKLFRGSADNLTPRALKIKSQSFCIGAGSSGVSGAASSGSAMQHGGMAFGHLRGLSSSQMLPRAGSSNALPAATSMPRAHSDMSAVSNSLTENQKKKLLWAVSQALQEKKISAKHENFKQYASVLARVVRRIFQEFYQKNATSNSETMLRLAKKYAFNVIAGRNADDIYFQAKASFDELKRGSSTRLSGYIGPEEFEQRKRLEHDQKLSRTQSFGAGFHHTSSMQNLFASENSVDSFAMLSGISQTSSAFISASGSQVSVTQSSCMQLSQEHYSQGSSRASATKQAIQVSAALRNSSSKNNLGGLALRENVDGEQRRSAQKNFTGKDQRNISPYAYAAPRVGGSAIKVVTSHIHEMLQPEKAKRQIIFDS